MHVLYIWQRDLLYEQNKEALDRVVSPPLSPLSFRELQISQELSKVFDDDREVCDFTYDYSYNDTYNES